MTASPTPSTKPPAAKSVFAPRFEKLTKETDAFGHLDYAKMIAGVVLEAEPPFTLGLYGPWGVGKSLILDALPDELGADCAFVKFDAWRYDGDTLRRYFFTDVARNLKQADVLKATYRVEKAIQDLSVDRSTPTTGEKKWDENQMLWWFALVAATVIAVVVIARAGDGGRTARYLSDTGLALLILIVGAIFKPIPQLRKVIEVTEIEHRVVEPERFTEKFQDLLRAVTKKRLVIAIDNLDRCSPKRVTELLETLNTFLEPAAEEVDDEGKGPTRTIFVVAADDAALRRHVESLEAQPSNADVDSSRPSRVDVGRYAEEYLRKIFTATIPIKPALPSELDAYVESELTVLSTEHEMQPEDLVSLTEVITEGLRRNPRRVTQFVRNLELRLRILDARHKESGRIATDLVTSPDIPFVAKLQVLEEEWPKVFEVLEADPSLLLVWHKQQENEQTNSVTYERLGAVLTDGTDKVAFSSFLGATLAVNSPQIRAYLSLKQSQDEVELTSYAPWEEALFSGNGSAIDEILAPLDPETFGKYAATLKPLAEGRSTYLSFVRVLIETALGNERLRGEAPGKLGDLLIWAMGRGKGQKDELALAVPGRILRWADLVPTKADFNRLVEIYLSREGAAKLPVEELLQLPADRLNEANINLIGAALSAEGSGVNPNRELAVLEWCPKCATDQVAASAVERFGSATAPVDGDILSVCLDSIWSPATRTRLKLAPVGEPGNQIVRAAAKRIGVTYAVGDAALTAGPRVTSLEGIKSLLVEISEQEAANGGGSSTLRTEIVGELRQALLATRTNIGDASEVAPLLDIVALAVQLNGVENDADDNALLEAMIKACASSHQAALIAYAQEREATLAEVLRPGIARALDPLIDADNQQALDALVAIDSANAEGVLSAALLRAVTQDRLPFVEAAIAAHPDELEPWRGELSDMALAQLAGSDRARTFAIEQAAFLSDEKKDALVQNIVAHIVATAALRDMSGLLNTALEAPALKDRQNTIIRELWERAKPIDPAPLVLLQLVAPQFKRLEKSRRDAFTQRVQEWLAAGAGVPLLSTVSQAALNEGEREAVVRGTLQHVNASIPNAEIAQRQQFFVVAEQIAAGAKGAIAQIEEAIIGLQEGTEADHQLYELLRPAEAPE